MRRMTSCAFAVLEFYVLHTQMNGVQFVAHLEVWFPCAAEEDILELKTLRDELEPRCCLVSLLVVCSYQKYSLLWWVAQSKQVTFVCAG